MKWKKLISFLIAMLITIPVFAANENENKYLEASARLYQLGLLEEKLSIDDLSQTITRAEAAKYILSFIGVKTGEKGCATVFTDVEKSNPYSQYIQQAYNLGLVWGYEDETYRPDNPMSYIETMSMFISALGYKDIADIYGSYPQGILSVADNIKISLGSSYNNKEAISVGEFVCIMDLAKDASAIEYVYNGMNLSQQQKESVLANMHNIFYSKEIMTANEYTGITDDISLGERRVKLGDEIYYVDEKVGDINSLLGCKVEFYYKESDTHNILLWARADKKNNIAAIMSWQIDKYSNGVYYYYKDGKSSLSRARISDDADVIYNGRLNLHMKDEQWMPDYGEITLIDNDGDGAYDIIKISNLQSIFVGAVFGNTTTIRDKITNTDISFGEDCYDVICIKDDKRIGFGEIKENNAVDIAVSSDDNERILVTIYVSDTCVEGTVEQYDKEEHGYDFIVIDGVQYNITPYAAKNANIQLKDVGTFYLNKSGWVVGVALTQQRGLQYGYFIKAQIDEIEEVLTLKILTADGRIMYYDMNEKAKVNGIRETNENVIAILKVGIDGKIYDKCVGQPIKYSLNAYGEIVKLITHDRSQSGDASVKKERIRFVKDFTDSCTFRPSNMSIDMTCGVSKDAVVFRVPDVDSQISGRAEDDNFSVEDISTYIHGAYRLQAFDDDEMGYCSLLLRVDILGGDTIDEKSDPYAMVYKTGTSVDDYNDIINVLYVYTRGKLKEIKVDEYTALVNIDSIKDLKRGSIIEYHALDNGEVSCIKLITTPDNFIPADTYDNTNRSRENVTVRGQVQRNNSEVMTISYEKQNGEYIHQYPIGESKMWFVPITGAQIHVYDRETNMITISNSLEDVKDYLHYGNDASLVMCQMTFMQVDNVFVIN